MRPLSEVERQVPGLMLAQDFPGAVELRAQMNTARVVRTCDCGCPTIDLVVEGDPPLATVSSHTPVNAEVDGVVGGGLIVFVDDGRLSGLEYYSAEDQPRRSFPDLDQIRPYV
jgi:hypothetical protein